MGVATTASILGEVDNDSSTPPARFYPIGTPGKPWGDAERNEWKAGTKNQRSYQEQVVAKLDKLKTTISSDFDVEQYGALSHDPERYPLFVVKSRNWNPSNPSLLVTGGVHGYETSGVQGALLFLETKAVEYASRFNIVVAPCVSPWGYEHIQRWQADVQDPNRSFTRGKETEESKALMDYLDNKLDVVKKWTVHVDLHETTDTDATEFMPAKHADAGLDYTSEVIPDGFYLVGDDENPQLDFQQAVIQSVQKVTHIAPPDPSGNIIDEPVVRDGIIVVPAKMLGLCCGMTGGTYVTTTEVYPDSPNVTDDMCNLAQVAAVTGALDYAIAASSSS